MARLLSLACSRCRHLLFRNDRYCAFCGRITPRHRARWLARGVRVALGAWLISLACWSVWR